VATQRLRLDGRGVSADLSSTLTMINSWLGYVCRLKARIARGASAAREACVTMARDQLLHRSTGQ
jgi:hypothetical protein